MAPHTQLPQSSSLSGPMKSFWHLSPKAWILKTERPKNLAPRVRPTLYLLCTGLELSNS